MITQKLQGEIHKLAVEKGWYSKGKRGRKELLALLHSEVAEALEDYRNGRMYTITENPSDPPYGSQLGETLSKPPFFKPVGFPSEIADIVIRAFDFKGAERSRQIADDACDPVIDLLQDINKFIAMGDIDTAIALCYVIAARQGFNLDDEVIKKHEFNKTRASRHGGKVI